MQAIVKTSQGIALQEKELPAQIIASDVQIKVTFAGLCRTDTFVAQNKIPVAEGTTLGHEFTGTITQIGTAVQGLTLGQRVGVMPVFINDTAFSMLGVERDGAFAEYITVPATNVYPVPHHLSDEEVAFLEPVAASLAVLHTPIQPNQRGCIYGNNRIAELTRRILMIKGFHTIDIVDDDDAGFKKSHYDFVIETIPTTNAFENIVSMVKRRGHIILKSRPYAPIPLPIERIVAKEITLIGAYYADFQEGIDLLASGALTIHDLFSHEYLSFSDAIPILLGEKPCREEKKIFIKST